LLTNDKSLRCAAIPLLCTSPQKTHISAQTCTCPRLLCCFFARAVLKEIGRGREKLSLDGRYIGGPRGRRNGGSSIGFSSQSLSLPVVISDHSPTKLNRHRSHGVPFQPPRSHPTIRTTTPRPLEFQPGRHAWKPQRQPWARPASPPQRSPASPSHPAVIMIHEKEKPVAAAAFSTPSR
jgi:hypothetical protein